MNHDILLYKMYNYGIRGVAYKWFVSYLSNIKQYTFIKDNFFQISVTYIMVFHIQGSVLGPLLFFIYVNDNAQALSGENSSCC